ncbi:MAG: sulfur oxidation c-type cytochrome SoxA [Reyranellaceae bacterium]
MRAGALGLGLAVLLAAGLALAQAAPEPRRSGYQDMGEALRRMQDDPAANPGMLFVQLGRSLWDKPAGRADKACAGCHSLEQMKGVAARYPAVPAGADQPVDLEGRINLCRTTQQQAEPLPLESQDLLALAALVAVQSRDLPIAPPDDPRLAAARERGAALWRLRQGQLNLSCANCHDDNAGRRLAAATIPQAHPTGYPIYRLEWQALGSLQRRLRNCLTGMRAEAPPYGTPDYVALEAWLMARAAGMPLESPAVRP